MTALNKHALRMRNYLDTALKSGVKLLHLSTDELKGLLDELESVGRTLTVNHEAVCSLVDENDELKRKLEAAENRIAELEAREITLPPTIWYEHDELSRDIPVLDKRLVKKAIRAAGIGVKGN